MWVQRRSASPDFTPWIINPAQSPLQITAPARSSNRHPFLIFDSDTRQALSYTAEVTNGGDRYVDLEVWWNATKHQTVSAQIVDNGYNVTLPAGSPAIYQTLLPLQEGGPGQKVCVERTASKASEAVAVTLESSSMVELRPSPLRLDAQQTQACGALYAKNEANTLDQSHDAVDIRFVALINHTNTRLASLRVLIHDNDAADVDTIVRDSSNANLQRGFGPLFWSSSTLQTVAKTGSGEARVYRFASAEAQAAGADAPELVGVDSNLRPHKLLGGMKANGALLLVDWNPTAHSTQEVGVGDNGGAPQEQGAVEPAMTLDGAFLVQTKADKVLFQPLALSPAGQQEVSATASTGLRLVQLADGYVALWQTAAKLFCRPIARAAGGWSLGQTTELSAGANAIPGGLHTWLVTAAGDDTLAMVWNTSGTNVHFQRVSAACVAEPRGADISLGARTATGLYFNGAEYLLIARGADTDTAFYRGAALNTATAVPLTATADVPVHAAWVQDRWVVRYTASNNMHIRHGALR